LIKHLAATKLCFVVFRFGSKRTVSFDLKTPKVPHIIGAGGATHPNQGQIDLQSSIGGLLLSQTFYVIPADFGQIFFKKMRLVYDMWYFWSF
jgi:hypothetical protein